MKKILILISIIIITMTSCVAETKLHRTEFLHSFDTVTQLSQYTNDEQEFANLSILISERLNHYHRLFNIYEDYEGINNIKTINDNAGIEPVKVDSEIIDIINVAKIHYENTNGHLNIAFGSVLSIWHEYREEAVAIPSYEELLEASWHTDIYDIVVDEEKSTVFISDPKMSLDLGAIAKGYTANLIAQEIRAQGYNSVLLNMGGNIVTIGANDDNQPWNIGVANYDKQSEKTYLATVKTSDMAIASSGGYERFYEFEGEQYSHIISKDSLFPPKNFEMITVIGEDAGLCDSLSTALFCMSYEEGIKIAENFNSYAFIWIFNEEDIRVTNLNETIKIDIN